MESLPRLIADVGGTYVRFAVETRPGVFDYYKSLECAQFNDFLAAVNGFRAGLPAAIAKSIQHAGVAIANPVTGDEVRMTNYHWRFSIEAMRQKLGLATLVVVNDFTALAMAVPRLGSAQVRQVGGGQGIAGSVVGLLGAGSGLGVSGLIPSDGSWVALGTEGGHTNFAPRDEREVGILRHAWRQFDHVSFERLLSGSGLELIYSALASDRGKPGAKLSAREITTRALTGDDPLCKETTETFCMLMGTAAANLALTLGALGGIYIGGGIVPRLGEFFDRSGFRARFESKGRFSDYLRSIPTYVITAPDATLIGVSAILAAQINELNSRGQSPLLERMEQQATELSSAEEKVARYVLNNPRDCLTEPVSDIAQKAGVSQPTVIRFCRSIGFKGLAEFKLRLASELRGTLPLTHAQVRAQDSVAELGNKVLSNTVSAILSTRDQLNGRHIAAAVALVQSASRVDLFAFGQYSVVADDAQFKILRFGIPCAAYTEERLIQAASAAIDSKALAVFTSMDGESPLLVQAAQTARLRGAKTLAITTPDSSLASQIPMISRILHLLLIDVLTVGLAMQPNHDELNPDDRTQAGRTKHGINTAHHLTSHSSA
jgi:glucokinase